MPRSLFAAILAFLLVTTTSASAQDEAVTVTVQPEIERLIAELTAAPQVQEAFELIEAMNPQLRDELVELTEIPAPPFMEEERALRFAEMLREAGLSDVTIDAEGNVIGRRPGNGGERVVAMAAHLDTVFPPETDVTVRIEGDTFYAPGVGDNTRGLVVLLAILRAMDHAGIETDADILFVGNVGEEGLGDLRGVKHLFREGGPRIDALIAVDGGRTSRLIYGGVGSHRYRVTFKGPGGHSWGAFGRASPHHALGRAINAFVTSAHVVIDSPVKTSYNVGRIGGGTSVNSIAFESWMEVDLRSETQEQLDAIDEILQQAVRQALAEENAARTEDEELTVSVERIGKRPAARGPLDSTLVQQAAAAMQALGIEPEPRLSSTDANHPLSLGIPAITLSRGGVSSNAHAPDESWQDVDSHVAVQVSLLTLLAEAGTNLD